MNVPVFDLHCDTASRMLETGSGLRKNALHIDLERAKTLPGYVQCFACFTTTEDSILQGKKPVDVFEAQLAGVLLQLRENADRIAQAFTPEDIENILAQGKMAAVLTIEGPAGFGFDPAMLEDLYKVGFRISNLGWNEKNPLIGSHKTGGGLTDLGREYVKECQRLGIVVDVSHCSDEGFWDIMDVTEGPIIASHSNSRAVCNHSRNLTDEMFTAICRTGGVAGFNQCAPFVGAKPDLSTVCDHILHLLELDPEGKHIALGADLDGCDVLPEGFTGIDSYPAMYGMLLSRGVREDLLRNIFFSNAMGVMQRAVCNNQKSQ